MYMKNLAILLITVLAATTAYAQSSLGEYDVNGTMSVARGCNVYADTSSWVHIGEDTTNKGVILPNVLLNNISTTRRGLFVYGLEDSVLYHFDGTTPVRYMTYKDTTFIKNLTGIGGGSGDVTQGGNTLGQNLVLGTTDNFGVSLLTNNTQRAFISNKGKVTFTADAPTGYDNGEVITIGNGTTNKMYLGVGSGANGVHVNEPFIRFGPGPGYYDTSYVQIQAEICNVYSAFPGYTKGMTINTAYATIGDNKYGLNIISKYTNNSNNQDIISFGSANTAIYTPTAGTMNFMYIGKQFDSQIPYFKPASGNADFNMMYLYGRVNQTGTASGRSRGLYINTFIENAVDWRSLEIGVNTGYGIYQSGSAAKNYMNGNTSFGSTNNTAKVDITGANGYDQLRMRTSYTPTGNGDPNGEVGDIAWDENYIYIKTNNGWKRTGMLDDNF